MNNHYKRISERIKDDIKQKLIDMNISPMLAIVNIGDNIKVKSKIKALIKDCKKVGIDPLYYNFSEAISENSLINILWELNNKDKVYGIVLQHPVPDHIDIEKVCKYISDRKDVEGLNINNKIYSNNSIKLIKIVLEDAYGIDFSGKNFIISSDTSRIRGLVSTVILDYNGTVSIMNSNTPDDVKAKLLSNADAIIIIKENVLESIGIISSNNKENIDVLNDIDPILRAYILQNVCESVMIYNRNNESDIVGL